MCGATGGMCGGMRELKKLLESGKIGDLEEIVTIIGKTKFKNTVGMHYDTFRKRLKTPEDFSHKHIKRVADLIGANPRLISNLIFDIMDKKKKGK